MNAISNAPAPVNEPINNYYPQSSATQSLKNTLSTMKQQTIQVPLVIAGKKISDRPQLQQYEPHAHSHVLASYSCASSEDIKAAISSATKAQTEWGALPWEDRANVLLRAAQLLTTKYRDQMNAATMLGQSKTCFQAEIDAVCELADFLRFNVKFAQEIYSQQPLYSSPGAWNRSEMRGLEGFVLALSPFNFSSIALNLALAPVLMGCTTVWKPAPTAVASAWIGMQILEEAGLPPGVINFIPGDASTVGEVALTHPQLAGVHFTGSTQTFNHIWQTIGNNISEYRSYPRIVGETGGKDFIFAHPSADTNELMTALIRGAFEYQGQKCSATSRAYIPQSIWNQIKAPLIDSVNNITMGSPTDFCNFMGAVIDRNAFNKITQYIEHAKNDRDAHIVVGGEYDDSKGYFIRPTIIETTNPQYKSMVEEIFGPVLTVYPYDDNELLKTTQLCANTSSYALTGAIFAKDQYAINKLSTIFTNCAGNFYINDKPSGAVVGQQPFGGSRKSGTNDKAGSMFNLLRWTSHRTIKSNFSDTNGYRYPHMKEA